MNEVKTKTHSGMRGATVCVARKVILTAALGAFVAAARADVYSNALFWARGIGVDYNSNGAIGYKEVSDSLNRLTTYGEAYDSKSDTKGSAFATMDMRLPYRGADRVMQCVRFAQKVTVTDPAIGAGTLKPEYVKLPTSIRNALANREDFAFAVRIRPDIDQLFYPCSFVSLGWGPDASKTTGFEISLSGTLTTNAVGTATNVFSQLRIGCSGNVGIWPSSACKVALGDWNDIVVSVRDGTNLTILVSRGGNLWGGRADSDLASMQTTLYTVNASADKFFYPAASDVALLGARLYVSGESTREISPSSARDMKSVFRGCFQSVAVWTNALTMAEMREAAAWPRPDLWRVGVEDGESAEFNGGSGAVSTIVVDEDHWMLQETFVTGASATFRFPLDTFGEAQMPQLLRVRAASGSSAATLEASVNGTSIGRREIVADNVAVWFVKPELLVGGATNAISVIRTDSGTSAFKFDAVSFGGSVQYGLADGGWYEFGGENANQNTYNPPSGIPRYSYYLIGGNWLDGPRAFYRADSGSSFTHETLRFDIPEDVMAEDCRWCLSFRMLNGKGADHKAGITLNGRALGVFDAGEEHDLRVPRGLVVSTGNELLIQNTSTGDNGWMAPDFLRIYLAPTHDATVISIQ